MQLDDLAEGARALLFSQAVAFTNAEEGQQRGRMRLRAEGGRSTQTEDARQSGEGKVRRTQGSQFRSSIARGSSSNENAYGMFALVRMSASRPVVIESRNFGKPAGCSTRTIKAEVYFWPAPSLPHCSACGRFCGNKSPPVPICF